MFCEKCGAKIEEGKEYCPSCGNKADSNISSERKSVLNSTGSSSGAISHNYQIPSMVTKKPLDKLKRNKKRVIHLIGCILMFLAIFRPFVAYNISDIVDKAEEYGYNDSQIKKIEEKAREESREFSAVKLCGEKKLDCFALVVVLVICLIAGILLD